MHGARARPALHGFRDCCKTKLRDAAIRLVCLVEDRIVTVSVIAIGRRDDNEVCRTAAARLE
jgi:mRNA interferase RelE/StbE